MQTDEYERHQLEAIDAFYVTIISPNKLVIYFYTSQRHDTDADEFTV